MKLGKPVFGNYDYDDSGNLIWPDPYEPGDNTPFGNLFVPWQYGASMELHGMLYWRMKSKILSGFRIRDGIVDLMGDGGALGE
jgi:hypothetical protein